ncbi:MAG TPA: calcium-binding protein [Solirubrobacterales bacterium]|nr:calcium-binding protein [Solirubrobacterales bacterium]
MAGALRWRRLAYAAFAGLLALGLYLLLVASPDARRPRCAGKAATAVSNHRFIHGTRGPDVIVGGGGPNRILGGGGNDTICGGAGRDRIDGGRGKDTLNGKAGADLVEGGRGSDDVRGGAGRDRVRGDSGNDVVRGGPGARDDVDGDMGDDTVRGGSGSFDALAGGIGRDRIDGGAGAHDTASYRTAGGPIEVDFARGRVSGAESERLVGIEDVLDGPGNDGCFEAALAVRWCGPAGIAVSGSPGDDWLRLGLRERRLVISGGAGPSVQIRSARRIGSLLVSLGAGDDRLALSRSLPPWIEVTIEGGAGQDRLRGGRGDDTLYAGDDDEPDRLEGGGGDDALFGVNIFHPRRESGAATMVGGGGDDLLIGGQPCDGDVFVGGPGATDSASFARVRNSGVFVEARIGGSVGDPDVADCREGRIAHGTEKIEGSPGPDVLAGGGRPNVLLGRGGADRLDGRGGEDRCIGGRGGDRSRRCEYVRN